MTNPVTGATFLTREKDLDGEQRLEIESWLPPGWEDPWRHRHPVQEERVRVLEGAVIAEIGGWSRDYSAGESFIIPPRTEHALCVAGEGMAHIATEMTPPLRTAELEYAMHRLSMFGLLDRSGRPKTLPAVILAREFAAEFELVIPPARLRPWMVGALRPLARSLGYRSLITQDRSDRTRPSTKGAFYA